MTPKTSAPQPNKQALVACLRDICLDLVQTHGALRELSGYAVTEVALAPSTIRVMPWREMSLLDVWYEGAGRVLTLRLEESAITILSCRRGAWEGMLLELPSKAQCS